MTEPEPQKLSRHIETPLDDARVERQWAAIQEAGLPDGAGRARRLGAGLWLGAAAVAAGALLFVLAPGEGGPAESTRASAGEVMESAVEPVTMGLSDGSEVELLPRTRLKLESERAEAVELSLESGVARFSVSKRRARRFSVRAGDVRVTVIGTRFELRREGATVDLRVSEGVVEVSVPGGEASRRVLAGERFVWDPSARPEPVPEPEAEESEPVVEQPRPERSSRKRAPAPPTAAELFERANVARRSGRMAAAVDAYEQLVREHGQDARAGLSSFEVGRIRMDALGDPRGAIAAFRRALSASGGSSYREDAMARIALAHDALGEHGACRKARERYLSRYPAGVHRAALSARCGDAGQ
ncbi:MAG: FecR domain-containing protein [Myxococcales bacterium]|nr:FecR domain-containing protein [Myxococcales bacterium]